MLTWSEISKSPALASLEAAAQSVAVLSAYTKQVSDYLVAGTLNSQRANAHLKSLQHYRDQLAVVDVNADLLSLYALLGQQGDLAAECSESIAVADKYIAELDSFLVTSGLKIRELTAQESAVLKAKLDAK